MHLCNRSTKENEIMIYSWGVNLDGHCRSSALLKAATVDVTNKQKKKKKSLQKKYSNSAMSAALVGVERSGMVELTVRSARRLGSPRLFEVRAQKTGITFQIPANCNG